MDLKIPDKITFKRKEVINISKLDGRVLDYWEKEFGGLKPFVNNEGEKFYSHQDLLLILKIKQLLVIEKKEKDEVKRLMQNGQIPPSEGKNETTVKKNHPAKEKLNSIRDSLQEILTILDKNDTK